MSMRSFIVAVLASMPMASPALADETVTLTPPLYREQARTTAAARPVTELATTPRLVPAVPTASRVVTATALPTR